MQTNYSLRQPLGLHGTFYAAHEAPDTVSYSAEVPANILDGSVAGIKGIPFGSVVSLGTNEDDQVTLGDPNSKGDFAIALRSVEREFDECDPVFIGYRNKETVACVRTDQVAYLSIRCPEGCNAGDPVDFDAVDGSMHNGGGGTVIPGARWELKTVAGEIGVVRTGGRVAAP